MTITTKAGLAAELGISKARVSQYVQRGLPVRSDGKLDREQALYWIKSPKDFKGLAEITAAERAGPSVST